MTSTENQITSNSGLDFYGWAYQTENDDIFFQRNIDNTGTAALFGFFENVPGLAGIAQVLVDATTQPYQVNGQQWSNRQGGMSAGSFHLHKCYTGKYTGKSSG